MIHRVQGGTLSDCRSDMLTVRPGRGGDIPIGTGYSHRFDELRTGLAAVACRRDSLDRDIVAIARSAIRVRLAEGSVTLRIISDQLRVSAWTLQRRLSDKGLNFLTLIEQVRKELALIYIKRSRGSLTEIALLLGYSESSAFSRAFRQWYGMSPRAFRRSIDGLSDYRHGDRQNYEQRASA